MKKGTKPTWRTRSWLTRLLGFALAVLIVLFISWSPLGPRRYAKRIHVDATIEPAR